MIRLMNHNEIDKIMDIWITAIVSSHRFIDQSFWLKQYHKVKQKLIDTPAYVICEQNQIVGFAMIAEYKYIAVYVISSKQEKGFGSLLIEYLKQRSDVLQAEVYIKNTASLHFFKKHGFEIISQQKNLDSHQMQNLLQWHK